MKHKNFLQVLEQHQQEMSQLAQTQGMPSRLNPLLFLIGLHFFKTALLVSGLLSLVLYLGYKPSILQIAKTLLLL